MLQFFPLIYCGWCRAVDRSGVLTMWKQFPVVTLMHATSTLQNPPSIIFTLWLLPNGILLLLHVASTLRHLVFAVFTLHLTFTLHNTFPILCSMHWDITMQNSYPAGFTLNVTCTQRNPSIAAFLLHVYCTKDNLREEGFGSRAVAY